MRMQLTQLFLTEDGRRQVDDLLEKLLVSRKVFLYEREVPELTPCFVLQMESELLSRPLQALTGEGHSSPKGD